MSWSPDTASVAKGPEVAARLAADRAYLDALRLGEEPADARLEEHDWLSGPHQSNQELAEHRDERPPQCWSVQRCRLCR